MAHDLEAEYGLTAEELLDALNKRFRAKVALEGAVAEVHLGKIVRSLCKKGVIFKCEEHDKDGYPDYSIWLAKDQNTEYHLECKNVRNHDEAFRTKGEITAYKVETQKTRSSKGDKSSRYYGADQFEVLAVCMGKKTHNWKEFVFIKTKDLKRHGEFKHKLAVIHPVPLPGKIEPPWYATLEELIKSL